MHYQIYLPAIDSDRQLTLDERMALCGLADQADNAMSVPCVEGPDKAAGTLVGWLNTAAGNIRCEYKTEEQTWIKSVPHEGRDAGSYWVGIWNDSPPTEGELRRCDTQFGEWTQLGDHKWKIPTPQSAPRQGLYNDDGKMRWEPLRRYQWLIDESDKYKQECLKDWGTKAYRFTFEPSEFVHWILKLLRVNYHITPEVAVHLEMWRDTQLSDAVVRSLGLQLSEPSDD